MWFYSQGVRPEIKDSQGLCICTIFEWWQIAITLAEVGSLLIRQSANQSAELIEMPTRNRIQYITLQYYYIVHIGEHCGIDNSSLGKEILNETNNQFRP